MSYILSKCPVCDLHPVKLSEDGKGGYLPLDPFECLQAQSKKIDGLKENILSLTKIIAATNEKVKELEKQTSSVVVSVCEKFRELEKQTALAFNEIRKQIQEQ